MKSSSMRLTIVPWILLVLLAAPAQAQICGDADDSGGTTVTDGVAVLRAAAGLQSPCGDRACDLDGSGSVTVTDGVNTLRLAAQVFTPLSCRTRFGDLVKTVRVQGVQANLRLGLPPTPGPDAPADVVAIEGAAEVRSNADNTVVVRVGRTVNALVVAFKENGSFVDGFAEVNLGDATGAIDVTLAAGDLPDGGTADLNVTSRAGDQLGVFRERTLSFVSSGSLGCDVVVRGTIGSPVESDRLPLGFAVEEGERLTINVQNDGTSPNFDVVWRLLSGSGAGASSCGGFLVGYNDCGPLPASGNPYQVEIADSFSNGTGAYQFHVQRKSAVVACEAVPIGCDQTFTGTIDNVVESDLVRLGFDAAEGERISINVQNATTSAGFDVVWRLLDRTGATEASCGGFRVGFGDCGPLAADGSPYQIDIADSFSNGSGAYTLHVQRNSAVVACETEPSCSLSTIVGIDLVRLASPVADGQVISVNVQNAGSPAPGFDVVWRLLDRTGAPAAACGGFNVGFADCGPLPASGNPYQIQIADSFSNATGQYAVSINGVVVPCS